jgi:hypothetical protein
MLDILHRPAPQFTVWALGSRVVGKARRYSDLDLAIITSTPFTLTSRAALAEAFSESDPPWRRNRPVRRDKDVRPSAQELIGIDTAKPARQSGLARIRKPC